jgi:hypothetical protein
MTVILHFSGNIQPNTVNYLLFVVYSDIAMLKWWQTNISASEAHVVWVCSCSLVLHFKVWAGASFLTCTLFAQIGRCVL